MEDQGPGPLQNLTGCPAGGVCSADISELSAASGSATNRNHLIQGHAQSEQPTCSDNEAGSKPTASLDRCGILCKAILLPELPSNLTKAFLEPE